MGKTVTISIRTPEELKNKLSEIAKEKDTSLNDVTSTVLADFVESYKPKRKTEKKEIPTAEGARKTRADMHQQLLDYALEIVGESISDMLEEGDFYTKVAPNEVADTVKKEFAETLEKLGYYLYLIKNPIYNENDEISHRPGELLVALNESDISIIIEADKRQCSIPPKGQGTTKL